VKEHIGLIERGIVVQRMQTEFGLEYLKMQRNQVVGILWKELTTL